MKLLKLENISKIKENVLMLNKINFELRNGQITGFVSDNNEKLDLLMNIISGIEIPDSGEIFYKSKQLLPVERLRTVAVATGNFSFIENLSVVDNIFLGNFKKYSTFGFINKQKIKLKLDEILKKLCIEININNKIKDLNKQERLFVELSRLLALETDFNIFGNITNSLSTRKYEAFVKIVQEMKKANKCVIILPSTLNDVKLLIDRLFLLKNSELIEIDNFKNLDEDKINEFLTSSDKISRSQFFDPIYKAKVVMEDKIHEYELDYRNVAQSVFMGYENFRRRFKTEVGISPNQYFLKIKMEKAKEMLLYTPLEIKEIADKLGFTDPYYFSRIFKKKESLSPARFREKLKRKV
jgi:ribose transport system ATP-binding protein